MASFRGHIGFGLLVAVFVTGIFVVKSIVTGFGVTTALFAAIVIGSFMPDLDSDASIVFSIIFSLFTAIAIGGALYWTYITYGENIQALGLALAGSLGGMWLIVRPLFMELTTHRGMFHSLPAAAVAGLIGYHATFYFSQDQHLALWFGIGFTIGYLAHLVLDELYAGINLDGTPFRPNKMLGTALKLYNKSFKSSLFTYCLLLALFIPLIRVSYD